MSLAEKIKCFRREHGISQEYMGEKLCMSQSTYSRLEQSDSRCDKYLPQIAEALGTTPEQLRAYSAPDKKVIDKSHKALLREKEKTIESQTAYVEFLNLFIEYTQTVWQKYANGTIR